MLSAAFRTPAEPIPRVIFLPGVVTPGLGGGAGGQVLWVHGRAVNTGDSAAEGLCGGSELESEQAGGREGIPVLRVTVSKRVTGSCCLKDSV
jgi:hypothetical protein